MLLSTIEALAPKENLLSIMFILRRRSPRTRSSEQGPQLLRSVPDARIGERPMRRRRDKRRIRRGRNRAIRRESAHRNRQRHTTPGYSQTAPLLSRNFATADSTSPILAP